MKKDSGVKKKSIIKEAKELEVFSIFRNLAEKREFEVSSDLAMKCKEIFGFSSMDKRSLIKNGNVDLYENYCGKISKQKEEPKNENEIFEMIFFPNQICYKMKGWSHKREVDEKLRGFNIKMVEFLEKSFKSSGLNCKGVKTLMDLCFGIESKLDTEKFSRKEIEILDQLDGKFYIYIYFIQLSFILFLNINLFFIFCKKVSFLYLFKVFICYYLFFVKKYLFIIFSLFFSKIFIFYIYFL